MLLYIPNVDGNFQRNRLRDPTLWPDHSLHPKVQSREEQLVPGGAIEGATMSDSPESSYTKTRFETNTWFSMPSTYTAAITTTRSTTQGLSRSMVETRLKVGAVNYNEESDPDSGHLASG